jgi:hypothetical protein
MSAITIAAAAKTSRDINGTLSKNLLASGTTQQNVELFLERPEFLVEAFSSPTIARIFFSDPVLQEAFFKQTADFRNSAFSRLLGEPVTGDYSTLDKVAGDHRIIAASCRIDHTLYTGWSDMLAVPANVDRIVGVSPDLFQKSNAALQALGASPTAVYALMQTTSGREFAFNNAAFLSDVESSYGTKEAFVSGLADLPSTDWSWDTILTNADWEAKFTSIAAAVVEADATVTDKMIQTRDGRSVLAQNAALLSAFRLNTTGFANFESLLLSTDSVQDWESYLLDDTLFANATADATAFADKISSLAFVEALANNAGRFQTVMENNVLAPVLVADGLAMNVVVQQVPAQGVFYDSATAANALDDAAVGKLAVTLWNRPEVLVTEAPTWSAGLDDELFSGWLLPTVVHGVGSNTAAMSDLGSRAHVLDVLEKNPGVFDEVIMSKGVSGFTAHPEALKAIKRSERADAMYIAQGAGLDPKVVNTASAIMSNRSTVTQSSEARDRLGFSGAVFELARQNNYFCGNLSTAYAGNYSNALATSLGTAQIFTNQKSAWAALAYSGVTYSNYRSLTSAEQVSWLLSSPGIMDRWNKPLNSDYLVDCLYYPGYSRNAWSSMYSTTSISLFFSVDGISKITFWIAEGGSSSYDAQVYIEEVGGGWTTIYSGYTYAFKKIEIDVSDRVGQVNIRIYADGVSLSSENYLHRNNYSTRFPSPDDPSVSLTQTLVISSSTTDRNSNPEQDSITHLWGFRLIRDDEEV